MYSAHVHMLYISCYCDDCGNYIWINKIDQYEHSH